MSGDAWVEVNFLMAFLTKKKQKKIVKSRQIERCGDYSVLVQFVEGLRLKRKAM